LWQQNCRVFAPSAALVHRTAEERLQDACIKELRLVTQEVLAHVLQDAKSGAEAHYVKWLQKRQKGGHFLRWIGLEDGRARFGLLPNYGTADILARYPSMVLFQRAQNEKESS
jgi:hypothetical protein